MNEVSPTTPAGWYDDPNDSTSRRYWDGEKWTESRAPKEAEKAAALPGAFWAALGGLGLIAAGSFGPWADAGIVSASGMEGDGVITVVMALVGLAILVPSRGKSRFGLVVVALLIGVVGVYDLANIQDIATGASRFVDPGWGLYAVVAGAAVLLVSAFWLPKQP